MIRFTLIPVNQEEAQEYIGKPLVFADDSGKVTHYGILYSYDPEYAYPWSIKTNSGIVRFKRCARRVLL